MIASRPEATRKSQANDENESEGRSAIQSTPISEPFLQLSKSKSPHLRPHEPQTTQSSSAKTKKPADRASQKQPNPETWRWRVPQQTKPNKRARQANRGETRARKRMIHQGQQASSNLKPLFARLLVENTKLQRKKKKKNETRATQEKKSQQERTRHLKHLGHTKNGLFYFCLSCLREGSPVRDRKRG